MTHCCRSGSGVPKSPVLRAMACGMIPGMILCLIPKCPLCLAAYFSIATGLVLPLPLASSLHKALIALCIASVLLSVAVFTRSQRQAFQTLVTKTKK